MHDWLGSGAFRKIDDWYAAASAVVVGDVTLGTDANLWYGTVLRGDDAAIHVGARTNIQDLTMVHADPGKPLTIGADVTVGHRAILHCVAIGDGSLIGMGSILMEDVVVGAECLIAAGAVLTPGTVVPPRSLVMGMPGKVVRSISDDECASFRRSAAKYVENAQLFWRQLGSAGGA